jgi:hypothetical protein
MINPDVGGFLDANCVAVGRKDVLRDDISDDNVCLLPYEESNADELCALISSEQTL